MASAGNEGAGNGNGGGRGGRGGRLTARAVATARHPGTTSRPVCRGDGGGLFLQVARSGAKSWLFRFALAGRACEMGLGRAGAPPDGLSLAAARQAAAEARGLLRQGLDPIEQRSGARRAAAAERERAAAHSFRAVAEAMVDAREAGWRSVKYRAQWRSSLATYAYPAIGDMPVAAIGTDDVLRVLRPIWATKPETASRLRRRIERVLAYARARGLRPPGAENPATWRGHLAEPLPPPVRMRPPGHHAALPWAEVGAFMAALRTRPAVAARALEFAILTAARTGEVLGARWREVDLAAAVWTVPAARTKAGREHRVPLTGAALAVLRAVQPLCTGPDGFVFPGPRRRGRGLSKMALLALLQRMNAGPGGEPPRWRDARTGAPVTVHGFRSTFRDWAGEASAHPAAVAEAALAHALRDRTEAAYARGDLLAKRRRLMGDWAAFCDAAPAGALTSVEA